VPAAAVIPAPIVYIKVVAVKKLVFDDYYYYDLFIIFINKFFKVQINSKCLDNNFFQIKSFDIS